MFLEHDGAEQKGLRLGLAVECKVCACSPDFTYKYMHIGLTEDAKRTCPEFVCAWTVYSMPCDPTGKQKRK